MDQQKRVATLGTGLLSLQSTLGCALLIVFTACSTSPTAQYALPPSKPAPELPEALQVSDKTRARALTSIGENDQPFFSARGDRLLFVSRGRSNHKNAQIYELQIETLRERRWTYSDGDAQSPSYDLGDKWILFASSTDEIKERYNFLPHASKDKQAEAKNSVNTTGLPLSEIYLLRTEGDSLKRVTQVPGFDGYPRFDRHGLRIVVTSQRFGTVDLYTLNLDGKILQRLTNDEAYDTEAAISPDGRYIVWVRWNNERTGTQLYVADSQTKTATAVTTQMAMYHSPIWHPNGEEILFSANLKGSQDIYILDRKGTCLRRVTDTAADETEPALSRDGMKLAFSSNQSGKKQIYLMNFEAIEGCQTPK